MEARRRAPRERVEGLVAYRRRRVERAPSEARATAGSAWSSAAVRTARAAIAALASAPRAGAAGGGGGGGASRAWL